MTIKTDIGTHGGIRAILALPRGRILTRIGANESSVNVESHYARCGTLLTINPLK